MKNLSFYSLLVLGLVCAQNEAGAGVASSLIHGNSCFNATAGTTLGYTQWGPYNNTNTGITVNCPLGLPDQSYTSISFFVWGYSRNSSNKLSCTLSTTASDGSNLASATATVPYAPSDPKNANATTYPVANISAWPYLTCYIPPLETRWPSYLTTIIVRGFY